MPCERSCAYFTDRVLNMRVCFRYVLSDIRPIKGVGYPIGVVNVEACVAGYMLGSLRKLKRPGNTCHPSFVEIYHLTRNDISAEEIDERVQVLRCIRKRVCPNLQQYV